MDARRPLAMPTSMPSARGHCRPSYRMVKLSGARVHALLLALIGTAAGGLMAIPTLANPRFIQVSSKKHALKHTAMRMTTAPALLLASVPIISSHFVLEALNCCTIIEIAFELVGFCFGFKYLPNC